jgi:cell division septum initiation protein DivIVA
VVLALAGCANSLSSAGARAPDTPPPVDRTAASAALLASYLEVLQRLVQGAPAEQAEILAAARRDYELAPTSSHQLRYALVLATPGHPGADSVHAQQLLRELLATPETLLPTERALAFLELQTVDRQLELTAENQRLQTDADRGDRERIALASKRLQSEQDENARLRKELDDVHTKLDAITNIERSVNKRPGSDRPPGTEGPTP